MAIHRYIVDLPFTGTARTITYLDSSGTECVAYCDSTTTLEAYLADPANHAVSVLDRSEMARVIDEYSESMCTEPKDETEEEWFFALEALPPERHFYRNGWELFSMSEYLTGDITAWHARKGDRFVCFQDRAQLPAAELLAKLT